MAERARLQRKIGRDAANAKRALGDDRSAAQVAAKKAVNAARPKGDDASGLVHHIIIPTDRTTSN